MTEKQLKVNDFLLELDELKKKYGFHLWSCNCCSSITLEFDNGEVIARNLSYDDEQKIYTAEY